VRAVAIEVLSQKGRFPSDQALAVVEVIDMAIADAQFVTVPILDARLAAMESRWDARFNALEIKFHGLEARFSALEQRFSALEQRFSVLEQRFNLLERGFGVLEGKFEAYTAKMDRKFDRLRFQLIVLVVACTSLNSPWFTSLVQALRHVF
jgi:hypothetical protein